MRLKKGGEGYQVVSPVRKGHVRVDWPWGYRKRLLLVMTDGVIDLVFCPRKCKQVFLSS